MHNGRVGWEHTNIVGGWPAPEDNPQYRGAVSVVADHVGCVVLTPGSYLADFAKPVEVKNDEDPIERFMLIVAWRMKHTEEFACENLGDQARHIYYDTVNVTMDTARELVASQHRRALDEVGLDVRCLAITATVMVTSTWMASAFAELEHTQENPNMVVDACAKATVRKTFLECRK